MLSIRRSPTALVGVLFLLLFLPSSAFCQITSASAEQAPPVQGAGHDYIRLLAETVSPSTGSVNVRIQGPVPADRELTLPFAITYDSNGALHAITGPFLGWADNSHYLAQGGWTYVVPSVSIGYRQYFAGPNGNPPDQGGNTPCYSFFNYLFTDATEQVHPLIGIDVEDAVFQDCVLFQEKNSFPQTQLTGGDLIRVFGQSSNQNGGGNAGPLVVADAAGNVYHFSNLTAHFTSGDKPGTVQVQTQFFLPDWIETRNGNRIAISDHGNGAFTVTDSMGRSTISATSFGASSDQISFSGAPAYAVTWAAQSRNRTFNTTIDTVPPGQPSSQCSSSGLVSDSGSRSEVQQITLSNGQSYTFQYESKYGLLSKLVYPTGAYVRYVWGDNPISAWNVVPSQTVTGGFCEVRYDTPALQHRFVSFDGVHEVLEQDFSYSTHWVTVTNCGGPTGCIRWDTKATTVLTKDLVTGTQSTVVYNYSGPDAPGQGSSGTHNQTPVETSIQTFTGNGSLLRTNSKTYFDMQLPPVIESTTLDNGSTSQSITCPTTFSQAIPLLPTACQPTSTNSTSVFAQIVDTFAYDFGTPTGSAATIGTPGPVLRHSHTDYHAFPNSQLISGTSILNFPNDVITYDGSGNRVSEIDYLYDQSAVTAVNNLPTGTHDETNYGSGSTTARGNPTTITSLCFQGSQTCLSGNATVTRVFDETGKVTSERDARGNVTSYSYADNFASGTGTPSGSTNAFLTTLTQPATNGVAHVQHFAYGFADSQLRSSTDENGNATSYAYNDAFLRPTQVNYPDGGQTTIAYNDAAPSPTVTTSRLMNASTSLTSTSTMDGMGHLVKTLLTSDPDCASGDRTDTTYDGLGRTFTASNPYCTTGDPTYGITTHTYDALGRTTQVTHPDSTTVLTIYTGRATQMQDEGNGAQRVSHISQVDGLGRLTSVCEVASGPFVGAGGASSSSLIGQNGAPGACGQDIGGSGFLTSYQYDALGNLTQVNQGAMAARSFSYDSLSRLTSASNPESGLLTYAYDANGNLATKTAPAPNQTGTTSPVTLVGATQASSNTGSTQWSVNASPVAGDALLVGCNFNAGISFVGVSDSAGDTFNSIAPEADSTSFSARAYLATNVTGGATTVTCTASTAPQNNEIYVTELQGINSANAVDTVFSMGGPSSPASGSLTTTNPNELVWAYVTSGTVTNATGWTALSNFDDDLVASLTQAAPATVQASFNVTEDWTLILVALNPTTSPGTTVTTTYTYDALNRLTQRSYSDGTTPTASFQYDSFSNYPNTVGRLVKSSVAVPASVGGCIQTLQRYDAMGRIAAQSQFTPVAGCANNYGFPYTYDLAGNMLSSKAPYEEAYTYTYNSAGRLTSMTGSNAQFPTSLLSAIHYNAAGQVTSDTLGDGEVETFTYDHRNRLQAKTVTRNGSTVYSFSLTLAPNGDVLAANDSVNGNWTYGYDAFNRLVCSSLSTNGTCVSPTSGTPNSYVYDRFGNRWQQNGQGSFLATFTGNNPSSPANNNRMDGFSYDAAGNMLSDGRTSYTYDAENRLIATSNPSHAATYLYDANGRRVHRTGFFNDTCDGSGIRDYIYDLNGNWVVENNSTSTGCNVEIYAGARHLASLYDGDALFDHTDWLGTSRLRRDVSGAQQLCTSLPFGDNESCSGGEGSSPLLFTGKERDSESGLDNFGARYDSSSFGRFMSPDEPLLDQEAVDPRSWNLYSYVRNNPLSNTDPTGNACVSDGNGGFVDDNSGGQSCANAKEPQKVIVQASPGLSVGDAINLIFFGFRIYRTADRLAGNLADLLDRIPPPDEKTMQALGMVSGFPEAELPELLAPAGSKLAQIIARLGIGRGDTAAAMKALSELRNTAEAAGQSATGFYIRADATIYRVGNDYLTVAKDGKILSYVKNATAGEGVALRYSQLGGK